MELRAFNLEFCLVPFFSLAVCWSNARNANLEKKIDALDKLFRGGMYLINERIEKGRQERDALMETLNETLEFLDYSAKREDNTGVETHITGSQCASIKLLFDKVEEKDKMIDKLSASFIRTKRGLVDEKKARKSDTKAIITQLTAIADSQDDLSENIKTVITNQSAVIQKLTKMGRNQDELVTDVGSLMANHNAVVEQLTDLRKNQDDLKNSVSIIINNQNNLVKKLEDIIVFQNDLVNKVSRISSSTATIQNTSEKLEGKQDAQNNNVSSFHEHIKTKLNEVVNGVQNIPINFDKTAQKISQKIQDVIETVSSRLNCGSHTNVDACLQKHFRSLENLLRSMNQKVVPVKLVGGRNQYEGRVEVTHEDRQGTVCDDGWDNADARVVCRMLGYSGGTAFHRSHFGRGTGEILLDNVRCTGNEDSLFKCSHRGIGVSRRCGHHEDAGVRCNP